MGVSYNGGMIVGAVTSDISEPEDYEEGIREWAYENDMDTMCQYYDCDNDECFTGFTVKDVPVSEMTGDWLKDVKEKAAKFEELTGVPALLIGTQDIG